MVQSLPSGMSPRQEVKWLNKFGAQEWEHYQVLDWDNQFDYYFKRPIATNEKLRQIQLEEKTNGNGPGEVTEKVSG
jgi:hypothetical protein